MGDTHGYWGTSSYRPWIHIAMGCIVHGLHPWLPEHILSYIVHGVHIFHGLYPWLLGYILSYRPRCEHRPWITPPWLLEYILSYSLHGLHSWLFDKKKGVRKILLLNHL